MAKTCPLDMEDKWMVTQAGFPRKPTDGIFPCYDDRTEAHCIHGIKTTSHSKQSSRSSQWHLPASG